MSDWANLPYCTEESCLPSDERVPYVFAVVFVAWTIETLIADAAFITSIYINDAETETFNTLLGGTALA